MDEPHLNMWAPFAAGNDDVEVDGTAGGVGDVTRQLEKQALEDKEKDEDGEEGASPQHFVIIVRCLERLQSNESF